MARHAPEHPRLTPMRALSLLVAVVRARQTEDRGDRNRAFDRTIEELESHIRAELVRRNRRS